MFDFVVLQQEQERQQQQDNKQKEDNQQNMYGTNFATAETLQKPCTNMKGGNIR